MRVSQEQSKSDAQPNPNSLSLFDLIVPISNAKALFAAAQMINPDAKMAEHDSFKELAAKQLKVIKYFVEAIFENYCNNVLKVTQFCQQELNIGNALPAVANYLTDVRTFQQKLQEDLPKRFLLEDGLLHAQINNLFERTRPILEALKALTTNRKLTSEQDAAFNRQLVNLQTHQDLLHVVLQDPKINQSLMDLKEGIKNTCNEFNLPEFHIVFGAFDELMKLNDKFEKDMFSEEDIEHLKHLFIDYFSERKKEFVPEINQAMYAPPMIKPIFPKSVIDYTKFLYQADVILHTCDFIGGHFRKKSAQVYKTYEGLARITNAKNDITVVLDDLILQIKKNERKKSPQAQMMQIKQIEYYKDQFDQTFQASMRFVMPVKELIKGLLQFKKRLADAQNKETLGFIGRFDADIKILEGCIATLDQKALSINALKDITDFKNEIKALSEEDYQGNILTRMLKPGDSSSNLFARMSFLAPPDYKNFFAELHAYLSIISQSSRTEDHTNFQAIQKRIEEIAEKNQIKIDPKKDTQNKSEMLAIKIYKRYCHSAKVYQADVKPQALGSPNG